MKPIKVPQPVKPTGGIADSIMNHIIYGNDPSYKKWKQDHDRIIEAHHNHVDKFGDFTGASDDHDR